MEQPLTVGEIAKSLPDISQSALSQHLSLLKAHGILSSTKSGQNVTYFIADPNISEIISVLRRHYCDRDPGGAGENRG